MYNGLEIDMLNLRDADSILVTKWVDNSATRILIDGGYKKDAPTVQAFLNSMQVKHIDHLVCSHIHDDHAAGLVELVNSRGFGIGQAWLHIPSNHVDRSEMAYVLNEAGNDGVKFARVIQASLQTRDNLHDALNKRGITIQEPFAGEEVGFMTVCGPSREFYKEKLQEFSNYDKLIEKQASLQEQQNIIDIIDALHASDDSDSGLLESPLRDPENEVSTILGTKYKDNVYLLTSDAGVQGLTKAKDAYELANLRFMQIPHHGSRRNVTQELIDHFAPLTAFVSAVGNKKHPRRAVVNAFKKARQGARVFSTHYPTPGNIWHHSGNVPDRPGYSSLIPLYEDNS